MKSTKKIFVVAIAALMLFAFTACNNTMPSAFKSVEYVEVQQIESFLKGEAVKESGFQVVINYTEGEPTVLKGSTGTIAFDSATDAKLAAVADGIEFLDKGGHPVVAVPAEIVCEDVTSATISGVETYTVEAGWKPSDFDDALAIAIPEELADATITLAGGDVTKTFSLADKKAGKFDYVLSLYEEGSDTPLAESATVAEGDTYNVYLSEYKLDKDASAFTKLEGKGLDTGLTVNVVAQVDPDTSITGLEVLYKVEGKRFVEGTLTPSSVVLENGTKEQLNALATSGKLYLDDTITWTVNLVKADDSKTPVTCDSLGAGFQVLSHSEGFEPTSSTTSAAPGTAVKTANIGYYDTVSGKTFASDITIPVGTVTVAEGQTVTASQNATATPKLKVGQKLTNNNVETYITISGLTLVDGKGSSSATAATAENYTITLPYGDITLEATNTFDIVVSYETYGKTVNKPVTVSSFTNICCRVKR